jgi:cytochrome c oxidase subunit 4
MSTQTATAQAHGAHGGADHVPHVLPLKTYIATWLTLVVLTVITVGVSYLDLGSANLFAAMLIATLKAGTVAAIFMHLKYDQRFHTLIFLMSLLFLSIMISFTMFDTETRGRAEAIEAERPADIKAPFAKPKPAETAAAAAGEAAKPGESAAPAASAAPSAEAAASAAPSASAAASASAAPAAAGSASAAPAAGSASAAPAAAGSATAAPAAHAPAH